MRHARRDREERAAFELIRSHMTPQWLRSAVIVQGLPVDANAEQIENNPQVLEAVHSIGLILEAIGYAVFIGIVPLRMVDQFWAALCEWLPIECVVTSNLNELAVAHKRAGSGFSGLASRLSGMGRARRICSEAPTKPIATGNRPAKANFCESPNQSMKSTAPWRSNINEIATTPCRGLSLSR